jgi:hypothetical protein
MNTEKRPAASLENEFCFQDAGAILTVHVAEAH